jgi:hypothetical protein
MADKVVVPDLGRHVVVDSTLTPRQALDATGRNQHVDWDVAESMPRGKATEVEIFFLKLGRTIACADLEREIDALGFKFADPVALLKANQDDPAFADTHPNGTQWKDAEGNYCFATFDEWHGKRSVSVNQCGNRWGDYWFFALVRRGHK